MIDHPAEQSHIWIGSPMLARHQIEDIFPFFVANYILGGSGFGSRLTTEVREKRGLSYSVFSGFSLLKQKGPFFYRTSDWQAKHHRCFKSSSRNTY